MIRWHIRRYLWRQWSRRRTLRNRLTLFPCRDIVLFDQPPQPEAHERHNLFIFLQTTDFAFLEGITRAVLEKYQIASWWKRGEQHGSCTHPARRGLSFFLDPGLFHVFGDWFGGPFECFYPPDYQQNPAYLTTVSCPFGVFRAMRGNKIKN